MDDAVTSSTAADTPLFSLLQNSHDGIVILNSEGNVLLANPAAMDIFGRSEYELTGSNLGLPLAHSSADGEKTVLEVLHKDGEPRTVEMATTETVWQGEPAQLALLHDITAQVEAEEKYRIIAENTGDLITVLYFNRIRYVSPSVETLLGYSTDEFAELGLLGTTHPDDREQVHNALSYESIVEPSEQSSPGNEGDCIRFVSRHRRRDGLYRWFETVGRMQTLETGRRVTVLNTRDISERVETKLALERSVEEKQFLLRELNHRVKNNLTLVGSLIYTKEASLGGQIDLSDLRNRIDVIRVVYDKLHQTDEASDINLRDYLKDLIETVFGSLSERSISTDINISDVVVPTKTAVPLGLIVNELATNAVKHGFAGHDSPAFRVRLDCIPTDDTAAGEGSAKKCVLVLSNSGPPIPEDVDIAAPKSLGLQLTTILTQQINGSLKLQKSPEPTYRIEFPPE